MRVRDGSVGGLEWQRVSCGKRDVPCEIRTCSRHGRVRAQVNGDFGCTTLAISVLQCAYAPNGNANVTPLLRVLSKRDTRRQTYMVVLSIAMHTLSCYSSVTMIRVCTRDESWLWYVWLRPCMRPDPQDLVSTNIHDVAALIS